MDTEAEKQHAHELIEKLGPHQVGAAVRILEFMLFDPICRVLATAPVDDEPETEQERLAVREAEDWFDQNGGKGIPMAEVLGEFGLTLDDFRRMAGSDPLRGQEN